jgi:hypothetical protein
MGLSICDTLIANVSAAACDIRPTRIECVHLYACNRSKRFLEKNIKERDYKKINKQIKKGTVIAKDHNGDKIYRVVLC